MTSLRLLPLLGLALVATLLLAAPAGAEDASADAQRRPELVVEATDGPLTVTLRAAPKTPRMGEPVTLSLVARIDGAAGPARAEPGVAPVSHRVVWPDLAESLVKALGEDIVEVGAVRRGRDGLSLSTELRFYDAGRFELPELTISLPGVTGLPDANGGTRASVVLGGAAIEVPSVLAEDAPPLPGRGAVAYEPELAAEWLPWAAGAAVLALAAAALLLLRRRRRVAPAVPPPPVRVPPHQRALEALRELADQRLPERGEVDPYFTQLSEILRAYLEERFGLRAPEQTTEEFLAGLSRSDAGRQAITLAHREILTRFLSTADLVKFARAEPDVGTCVQAGTTAERFVQETAPHSAVRSPASAPAPPPPSVETEEQPA